MNVEVSAKDRRGAWITQASYDFKVETETEHNDAPDNLPDTSPLDADDPDLGGQYNLNFLSFHC